MKSHGILTRMVLRSGNALSLITIDEEVPSGTLDRSTFRVTDAPPPPPRGTAPRVQGPPGLRSPLRGCADGVDGRALSVPIRSDEPRHGVDIVSTRGCVRLPEPSEHDRHHRRAWFRGLAEGKAAGIRVCPGRASRAASGAGVVASASQGRGNAAPRNSASKLSSACCRDFWGCMARVGV